MAGLTTLGLPVAKTFKLFIDGAFVRTESGRSFPVFRYGSSNVYAYLCQASRKDFRNGVVAAKNAFAGWSGKSAYNRGQILYRMAEMAESQKHSMVSLMGETLGFTEERSAAEVDGLVDALVYYGGFTDKYQQIMGAVNPVSSPHHNFTTTEPVGVVAHIVDDELTLSNLAVQIAATICSGNTLVTLLGPARAALIAPLAEIVATSDVPPGVVNLLCGYEAELYPFIGGHMEVHAINYQGKNLQIIKEIGEKAADNMKRVVVGQQTDLSLDHILNFVEYKTVWHPIGV